MTDQGKKKKTKTNIPDDQTLSVASIQVTSTPSDPSVAHQGSSIPDHTIDIDFSGGTPCSRDLQSDLGYVASRMMKASLPTSPNKDTNPHATETAEGADLKTISEKVDMPILKDVKFEVNIHENTVSLVSTRDMDLVPISFVQVLIEAMSDYFKMYEINIEVKRTAKEFKVIMPLEDDECPKPDPRVTSKQSIYGEKPTSSRQAKASSNPAFSDNFKKLEHYVKLLKKGIELPSHCSSAPLILNIKYPGLSANDISTYYTDRPVPDTLEGFLNPLLTATGAWRGIDGLYEFPAKYNYNYIPGGKTEQSDEGSGKRARF